VQRRRRSHNLRERELAMASGAGVVGVLVAIIVILVVGAVAGWLAGKIMASIS
jgi:hypothetical protein